MTLSISLECCFEFLSTAFLLSSSCFFGVRSEHSDREGGDGELGK